MIQSDSLDELLAAHFRRFQASHERARGQAGPSLFGSDRAIDHWTFDYAKRAIDQALGDAVEHSLASHDGGDPLPALRKFVDDVHDALAADAKAPPANEFGLRPSAAALATVRQHGMERLSLAQASLEGGRLDPRLKPPAQQFGNDKLILTVAVVVVVLAVLASI